jgi:hypothetical protein
MNRHFGLLLGATVNVERIGCSEVGTRISKNVCGSEHMNMQLFAKVGLLLLVIGCASVSLHASETTIVVGGTITQSTQDGTGPAVNNPSLNNIMDGDAYTLSLVFTGSITGPGTYTNFTSADFTDLTNPADESSFISQSLVITNSGGVDTISDLVCLPTDCLSGNQLALNFMIPAGSLNGTSVAASSVLFLTPMDLLEDDGSTDIQGTVTSYSYQSVGVTPEPASFVLCGSGLLALGLVGFRRKQSKAEKS